MPSILIGLLSALPSSAQRQADGEAVKHIWVFLRQQTGRNPHSPCYDDIFWDTIKQHTNPILLQRLRPCFVNFDMLWQPFVFFSLLPWEVGIVRYLKKWKEKLDSSGCSEGDMSFSWSNAVSMTTSGEKRRRARVFRFADYCGRSGSLQWLLTLVRHCLRQILFAVGSLLVIHLKYNLLFRANIAPFPFFRR